MRVGVDIDGVLYPWTEAANDALVARFGIPDPGPHLHWNWLKEQITPSQWKWLWSADGQDAAFRLVRRTYPDVVLQFNRILRAGHEVHFVTHRDPRRTAVYTADFLTRHFGGHPWAGLHVVQNGTPKHTLADWDVFVDDKPDTVLEMLIDTRAQVFCPARPWNGDLAHESLPLLGSGRFVRYTDPREVAEWVLAR